MNKGFNRRSFLKDIGISASALCVGFHFTNCLEPPEPEGVIKLFKPNIDDVATGVKMNPYLYIEPTGEITIFAHKPEMGQGTFQSIPMLIAEELGVKLEDVQIKLAPANVAFEEQSVGGSSSVRTMWEPMRKIGASAREMLTEVAARRWGISTANCSSENGNIYRNGSDDFYSFGQLVEEASTLEIPQNPKLKQASKFNLIGKSIARPDIPLKSTGGANFGMDMKLEGMVYASIERSPCFTGKVNKIMDSDALAVPGVLEVVRSVRPVGVHHWEGVAVIADNYWSAEQGRKALKIEWDEPDGLHTSENLFLSMRQKVAEEGLVHQSEGDFQKIFETSQKQLVSDYETPFVAHAPMEPMNTLANVTESSCELWTAVQFPDWIRSEAAEILEFEESQVTVHCPFMGGSFGRKGMPDFSLEGVLLSKQLHKPVKVIWSREDDIQQGPFRPGSMNRLSAALSDEGKLIAFQHKVCTPSFRHSLWNVDMVGKINPPWIMEPIGEPFYDTDHFSSNYIWMDISPIPVMWWRSVYSSTNAFGQECFIDELAHETGQDPVAFRLKHLSKKPNYKRFLSFLAEKANWSGNLPDGWARGIAITHCFESTTGQVIEVSRQKQGIKIERVVTAIDCGMAINPVNVKAQCEGCVVMGLTAAIRDGLTFDRGRVRESNFHDHRVLRMSEIPKMETFIFPSSEAPTGTGEPALPTVAPALANAIFSLTGKRIRKLPIDLNTV